LHLRFWNMRRRYNVAIEKKDTIANKKQIDFFEAY